MKLLRILAGNKVRRGPYKGMLYDSEAWCSKFPPKLLGTYELETQFFHEQIILEQCRDIAIIGAAEGYFAVGLALKIPTTCIHAFELDPEARKMMRLLAKKNGVLEKIRIHGECTESGLRTFLETTPLHALIMDVEGAEATLLRQITPNLLANTRLLIELHDFGKPEISQPLIDQISQSHKVTLIPAVERSPEASDEFLVRAALRLFTLMGRNYLRERPQNMSWLIAIPKDAPQLCH